MHRIKINKKLDTISPVDIKKITARVPKEQARTIEAYYKGKYKTPEHSRRVIRREDR